MTGFEAVVGPAVELAAKQAVGAIEDARHQEILAKRSTVRSCRDYLDAARYAIVGLEREFDEILVEALNINLSNEPSVPSIEEKD